MTAAPSCGVVLAAGGSRRFAGPLPKQLVEINGEPAVRRTVRAALASRLERVVVVTGRRAAAVRRAVDDLPVAVVDNPLWREGQSVSVKAGLAAAPAGAAAVVFIPCDQPFLTAGLIDALLAAHAAGGGAIFVPAWRGRRGSPVLIDRSLFGELAAITGDAGARQLFDHHPVVELALDDEAPLLDFDSESELRALMARAAPTP